MNLNWKKPLFYILLPILVFLCPESVTPEPATARLAPMASKIAVHRPFGAAAPLPWCVGRLS